MTIASDVLDYVVRPTLKFLDPEIPYSIPAEALIMGIMAKESQMGTWIDQTTPGPGPAFGPWQMEKIGWDDTIIRINPEIRSKLAFLKTDIVPSYHEMQGNWYYACAMCRAYLWLRKFRMPATINVPMFASIWKKYYNTPKGKGTVAEFEEAWKKWIAPHNLWR